MNNPFENTETAIKKDVSEVFEEIRQELGNTYFTSDKFDLSYIREAIVKRLETTLVNKSLLLADTVLIYLAKDARQALGDTDSKVINQFHEWNRQRAEKLKNEFKNRPQPETVTLPTDTRMISGGIGAATAVVLLPAISLLPMGSVLTVPISLGAGYLAYKATYHVSSSWAIEQLKEKTRDYLQQVEQAVSDRLLKVVEEYKQSFKQFIENNRRNV